MKTKSEITFASKIVMASVEEGIKSALENAKDDDFESHKDDREQIAELQAFLGVAIESWERHAQHNIHADTHSLVKELAEELGLLK